ncbi:IS3 family transposase [Pseudonocardia sp. RS010]|uniref:IS3 family transposase n=1 Tax=Pseudonocardia sp. RS010 TaxID=3385979 RepID=UPI0039A2AF96
MPECLKTGSLGGARKELCERAVRLYRESDPRPTFRMLAEQLGVHHKALRNWVRQAEADTLEQIVKIRSVNEFAAAYGSPRVWLELRGQGVHVGRKRVERVMREHGLQGAHLRRGWRHGSTRQDPAHRPAPDLLERDFPAAAPNRVWMADLPRIVTGEGVLWLVTCG